MFVFVPLLSPLVPLLICQLVELRGPHGFESFYNLPKELTVREATQVHLLTWQIEQEVGVTFNEFVNVLYSKLVATLWHISWTSVFGLQRFLFAAQNELEEGKRTQLLTWQD